MFCIFMYVAVFISLNNFICQVFWHCVHNLKNRVWSVGETGRPMSIQKRKVPAERVPDTSAGAGKKVTFVPRFLGCSWFWVAICSKWLVPSYWNSGGDTSKAYKAKLSMGNPCIKPVRCFFFQPSGLTPPKTTSTQKNKAWHDLLKWHPNTNRDSRGKINVFLFRSNKPGAPQKP